jgi:hypothetical protein
MRYPTCGVQRRELCRALAACLVFGVCASIAANAYGQAASQKAATPKKAAAPKKPDLKNLSIQQRLEIKSSFEFQETPLADVVYFLKDLTQMEIQLDKKALDDFGIASDSPVIFNAQDITVQSAMNLMLRQLNLTWVIKDDIVLITTQDEAEEILETKVYPVHDLVTPKPSYLFDGMYVPGMSQGGFPRTVPSSSGNVEKKAKSDEMEGGMGGGMGMGGMGGMMGGMGGGMFNISDALQAGKPSDSAGGSSAPPKPSKQAKPSDPPAVQHGESKPKPKRKSSLTITMDDLIDTITSCVKPHSWDANGGPGTISPLGGMLVVSQTREAHEEITKLLDRLCAASPGARVVTIRAAWLLLDQKQLNALLDSKKDGGIDRKKLEEMTANTKGYFGAITCFSGQTVHIASGRSRSEIIGATPVCGGGGEAPGYMPIVANPNAGVMLQVTPQLLPSGRAVLLDVCSSVTHREQKPETMRFLSGKPDVNLDRVGMSVEQLATTLNAPLGEPTLVGGLTRQQPAETQEAAASPQLYLFIEAR